MSPNDAEKPEPDMPPDSGGDTQPMSASPSDASESPSDAPTSPIAPVTATPPAEQHIRRGRLIWINVLIGVTTLLAVVAIFSIWANRLLFNPDNWENTSTQLLQNSDIRSATANYVVDQIYANVNVAGLLGQKLPPQLQPLAGPAAGALRNAAVQGVELALSRPRVQSLWATANRAADQTFIAVVNGGKGPVGVKQGVVTLDLASIVDNVATRLGLPADLGAKLPPSVANLTVLKSDQIKLVQNGGKAVKGLALLLTILVPLLYALAIFLARKHRRRTLMTVGLAIVFAGVVGLLGRSLLESQITNSLVKDASVRPAAQATLAISTSMINEISGAFILFGIIVVLAAWFGGPGRLATSGRRAIAPTLRDRPGWAFGTVAAVMVVVFIIDPIPATGKPVGMLVFFLLAMFGTEVLRRQTAHEFPEARAGEATAAMRTRVEGYRERRHRDKSSAGGAGESLPQQLERLKTLRDQHAISDEEYAAAKERLLQSA